MLKDVKWIILEYSSGAVIKAPTFTNQLGFETYQKMIDSL